MDPVTMFMIKAGFDIVSGLFGSHSAKEATKKRYEIEKKGIKSHFRMVAEDLRFGVQEVIGGIRSASYAQGRRDRAPGIEKSEIDKYQLRTFRVLEQESQALASLKEGRRQAIKSADASAVTDIANALIDYGTNTAKKPSDAGDGKSTGLTDEQVAAGMAATIPDQYAGYNDNWSISAEKLLRDGRNILKVKRY